MKTLTTMLLATLILLAGCASTGSPSPEMAELRRENEALREQLSYLTATHMREVALAAIEFAMDHDDRLPARPSDLRARLGDSGWQRFISPSDYDIDLINELILLDDPWAWVDEHGSYEFLDGTLYEADSIFMRERDPETRYWAVFGDGHAELLEARN